MSETPRTDAAEAAIERWLDSHLEGSFEEMLRRPNCPMSGTKLARQLERELNQALASLPISTNRTRDEARQMCGPVLRHDDGEGKSHGCVEAMSAHRTIDALIGDTNQLRAELAEIKETQRQMILDAFPVTEERVKWEKLIQERDQWRAMARELAEMLKLERSPGFPCNVLTRFNEMEKENKL